MTVKLSQLRVTADADTSKYVAAMNAKIAADKGAAGSSREVGVSVSETDQKLSLSGNAVAQLSRRYIEGFRAQEQFERGVRQVGRALDTGKMSMEQASAILTGMNRQFGLTANATELAEQGYLSLSRAVSDVNAKLAAQTAIANRAAAATSKVAANQNKLGGGVGGAGSFQTANIAAQFQDIGVTAAMGMSPMQIALQQGTQLSAVLNTMEKPVRGLAAAFMSVLNPVSLVTIGVIALGTYALQYFMRSEEDAKSLDAALKAHAENIRDIKEKWGSAAEGVREYVQKSGDLIKAQNVLAGAELKKQLDDFTQRLVGSRELVSTEGDRIRAEILKLDQAFQSSNKPDERLALERQIQSLLGQLDRADEVVLGATAKFGPLTAEINRFAESVRNGTPDFIGLQDAIARGLLADPTNQDLLRLAKRVGELVAGGEELQRRLPASAGAIDSIGAAANRNIGDINAFAAALKTLANIAVPAMSSRELAEKTLRDGMTSAGGMEDRLAAMRQYEEALKRIENAEAGARVPTPTSRPNDIERLDWEAEAAKRSAGDANAYRDLVKAANDRIEQMELEEKLIGKTGVAAQAYRFELDLLQRAQNKGRSITDEQIKQLKEKAARYSEVAQRVAAAGMAEELAFERAQMFRSSTEQRVYADLRGAGIDPASARGQFLAGQIRLNEQLKESREIAGDFASTFANGLLNGKSAMEAFGDASLSVLDRIVDKLLNDVLNALFQVNNAGSGGGGLLSGLLGMLGMGGGASLSPAAWNVVSSGGMTGLFANGGAFAGGVQMFANGGAFTNSVVSRPTLFPFANGTGLMGEAGPEAIMPLRRDGSGRLGVSAANDRAANNNQPAQYVDQRTYHFTGTSEEFEEFKKFVAHRDAQFDDRAVQAVKRYHKSGNSI